MTEDRVFWGDWCALLPASGDVRAERPEGDGDRWASLDRGIWVPASMMSVTVPVADRKSGGVKHQDFRLRTGGELEGEVASALPDAAGLDEALRDAARRLGSLCAEALNIGRPQPASRIGQDAEAMSAPSLSTGKARSAYAGRVHRRKRLQELHSLRERRLQPLPRREEPCRRLLDTLTRQRWPAAVQLTVRHGPDGSITGMTVRQKTDILPLSSDVFVRADSTGLVISASGDPDEAADDYIGNLAIHFALAIEDSGLFPATMPLVMQLSVANHRRRTLRFPPGATRFNLLLLSSGEAAAGDPDLKGTPPDVDPLGQ